MNGSNCVCKRRAYVLRTSISKERASILAGYAQRHFLSTLGGLQRGIGWLGDDAEGFGRPEWRPIGPAYSWISGQTCKNLVWNGIGEVSSSQITALKIDSVF